MGIAVATEFARYRIMRVPFIGVPCAVVRDRHSGRREVRAVPAEGPMQADFFRHYCRLTSGGRQRVEGRWVEDSWDECMSEHVDV